APYRLRHPADDRHRVVDRAASPAGRPLRRPAERRPGHPARGGAAGERARDRRPRRRVLRGLRAAARRHRDGGGHSAGAGQARLARWPRRPGPGGDSQRPPDPHRRRLHRAGGPHHRPRLLGGPRRADRGVRQYPGRGPDLAAGRHPLPRARPPSPARPTGRRDALSDPGEGPPLRVSEAPDRAPLDPAHHRQIPIAPSAVTAGRALARTATAEHVLRPSLELGLPSTHTMSLTRTGDDLNVLTHKARMADTLPEIKHVVLLMLENRSFDHMLGGLPGVNGASAAWTNSDAERSYAQTPIERWEQDDERTVDPDPKHETSNLLRQMQNNNTGFVADYAEEYPETTPAQRQKIMSYYPHKALGPLHTLATNFAICQRWHASVPGPTWTNRLFALSGTSLGRVL